MMRLASDRPFGVLRRRRRAPGTTLAELLAVLAACLVGTMSLVRLFPVGLTRLADETRDSRAAVLAGRAVEFSQAGEDLLTRTAEYVATSRTNGSADGKVAGRLREEYGELAEQAADMEAGIRDLRAKLPRPRAQGYLSQSLAQIQTIQSRLGRAAAALSLLQDDPSEIPLP